MVVEVSEEILRLVSERPRNFKYLLEHTQLRTYGQLVAVLRRLYAENRIVPFRHPRSKLIYIRRVEETNPNVTLPDGEGTVFIG